MEYEFLCPACGRSLWATTRLAGARIECPFCGRLVLVQEPVPPREDETCPVCGSSRPLGAARCAGCGAYIAPYRLPEPRTAAPVFRFVSVVVVAGSLVAAYLDAVSLAVAAGLLMGGLALWGLGSVLDLLDRLRAAAVGEVERVEEGAGKGRLSDRVLRRG